MPKQSFEVEFFAIENINEAGHPSMLIKYKALITVVSLNFQLFKVSRIQKIMNDHVIHLSESYFLTSYPSDNNEELKWKDASTFKPDSFLEMVGAAIEDELHPAIVHEYDE